MRQRAHSLLDNLDRYLILGVLLIVVQYLIFSTIDFPIYGSLCLHHIPEVFGCLFIGFWLAHDFPWWVTPLIYTVNLFWSELLFKHSITLSGIIAGAMVSFTLLVGDWTERYRSKRKQL
jgi:hypothetical protein